MPIFTIKLQACPFTVFTKVDVSAKILEDAKAIALAMDLGSLEWESETGVEIPWSDVIADDIELDVQIVEEVEEDSNDLDDIPEDQTSGFNLGVTEVSYPSQELMDAFLCGLDYAENVDVYHGVPFERNDQVVCRVCVGNW